MTSIADEELLMTANPIALVRGTPILEAPEGLYIPPDALEVFLETFAGPLDLLLYLIRQQNLDILDIPIHEITTQYMNYVELMQEFKLELAAEYLVMAAILCEIKSQFLLPSHVSTETENTDPRAELVRRLQDYAQFQQAALALDALPRLERDHFMTKVGVPTGYRQQIPPDVELDDLLAAFRELLARADLLRSLRISKESLSVRERMATVLQRLEHIELLPFEAFFDFTEGRAGVVVSFLALLELSKIEALELIQPEPFALIYVRLREKCDVLPAA